MLGKKTVHRRRHPRNQTKDNINGVTNPAIRRLCRRGGIKRISNTVYPETRNILSAWLDELLRVTCEYTRHAKRKTVSTMDVIHALGRKGVKFYAAGK